VEAGQYPALAKRRERQAAAVSALNTVKAIAEDWFKKLSPTKSESWRLGTRGRLELHIYPAVSSRRPATMTAGCSSARSGASIGVTRGRSMACSSR